MWIDTTMRQSYKKWFDNNYSKYDSIYQAVGLEESIVEEPKELAAFRGSKSRSSILR